MIELATIAALVRARRPEALPVLRSAIADPDPALRALAQIGLARIGDDDPDPVAMRLAIEGDLGVFAILVARAGRVAIADLEPLAAQAAYPRTPPELRASCAWAVAEHDLARGRVLADALAADDNCRDWLGSIVAQRGGALAVHVAAGRRVDRVGLLVR
jgi:hypothetical protein